MLGTSLHLVILFVALAIVGSIVFIASTKIERNDKIQFSILIVLAGTMIIVSAHLWAFIKDTNLRQRPFVGLSEITANFLGDKEKQKELDKEDEIAFLLKFENKGLSTAKVQHIKLKMFYGIFSTVKTDAGGKKVDKPSINIVDMIKEPKHKFTWEEVCKEVPAINRLIYKNIILLPRQSTVFRMLIHALTLKDNLYQYNPLRPAPIFIETEIKYSNTKDTPYYHHSRYILTWLPAYYNQFVTHLHKSTDQEEPLHLTVQQFISLVAEHQEVEGASKT